MALEGFLAGLVVATPFALFWGGEPSIPMQPVAYADWFAILGVVGMLNSLTLYVMNAAPAKRLASDESDIWTVQEVFAMTGFDTQS